MFDVVHEQIECVCPRQCGILYVDLLGLLKNLDSIIQLLSLVAADLCTLNRVLYCFAHCHDVLRLSLYDNLCHVVLLVGVVYSLNQLVDLGHIQTSLSHLLLLFACILTCVCKQGYIVSCVVLVEHNLISAF